jgi:hypothetical protein
MHMRLAAAYARLAASPDFVEQTTLAAIRAEHRKELTDTQSKFVEEISALRQELVAARRELNSLRAINECYARKLKTYDGIAQLIAAAARTEPVP